MAEMAAVRLLLTAAIAGAIGSCAASFMPAPPPSEDEARQYVAQAVRLAQAGEFERLCAMGAGNCEEILDQAGRDNVPVDPPTIVRIYAVPNQRHADGSWSVGGQMVELCGTDLRGAEYRTQMLVFRDHSGRLISIEPIYWSGIRVITGGPSVTVPGSSPAFDC
jgi:hypothetical protein